MTDTKLARLYHRSVYASVIPVHTDNGLHYFRIYRGGIQIKIDHGTSLIAQSDPDGWGALVTKPPKAATFV